MEFEWNDGKAERNIQKHGISFEIAARVFRDPNHADFDASHPEDGETRRKAVGVISGKMVTVVYTMRDGAVRIISARQSNMMEKRRYGDR